MSNRSLTAIQVDCQRNHQRLFVELSFTLSAGECLYVRGENGVGKTTLLRALSGLAKPHAGRILWEGNEVHNNSAYQSNLFFLGHKNSIKSSLTCEENLRLSAHLREKKHKDEVLVALEKVNLKKKQRYLASELSAGQKQRLALSKLLFSKAKIWILDEPFVSLDREGVSLVQQILQNHLKTGGLLIFTSHQIMNIQFPHQTIELVSFQQTEKV